MYSFELHTHTHITDTQLRESLTKLSKDRELIRLGLGATCTFTSTPPQCPRNYIYTSVISIFHMCHRYMYPGSHLHQFSTSVDEAEMTCGQSRPWAG